MKHDSINYTNDYWSARPGRIVRIFLHVVVVGPGAGLVGPVRRLAQPQKHAGDDFVFIDRIGNGLAHPLVRKQRIFQIVAQVGVGKGQVAVLRKIVPKQIVVRLARVLPRREPHHFQVLRAQFQKHRRRVGNDARDAAVDVRPAVEIIFVGRQNDFLPGHPFLERVRSGPDGM